MRSLSVLVFGSLLALSSSSFGVSLRPLGNNTICSVDGQVEIKVPPFTADTDVLTVLHGAQAGASKFRCNRVNTSYDDDEEVLLFTCNEHYAFANLYGHGTQITRADLYPTTKLTHLECMALPNPAN